MAEVLVLVEHSEGAVKKVTTELLTAARTLGTPAAVAKSSPSGIAATTSSGRRSDHGAPGR